MAFTVEGKDGIEITVGTIEGLRLVLEELRETSEETSETSEEDSPLLTSEQLKEGDMVRILTEPGIFEPGEFHGHVKGSIGIVTEVESEIFIEVEAPGAASPTETIKQTHTPSRLERVEPLGVDANGEDLFEGDYVTGAHGNGYTYTDDSVIMKVILKEDAVGYGIRANIGVEIVGEHTATIDSFEVNSERFIRLSRDLDEAMEKFAEIQFGEVQRTESRFKVGDKVRIVENSTSGLPVGDVGEIVRVAENDKDGYEYYVKGDRYYSSMIHEESDLVRIKEEKTFSVGDKVRVTGNYSGHYEEVGEVRVITEVDRFEPKYNLSRQQFGSWADTKDIELVAKSGAFEDGDIVKVTEAFEDEHGDKIARGTICEYEDWGGGLIFLGSVVLGDNYDKIQLVCRKDDRKDIEL